MIEARDPSSGSARSSSNGPRGVGLRSLTIKVALLFAAVILVAFGVVFFYIVPQLRSNLEQQVLDDLAISAEATEREIEDVMGTEESCARVDLVVRQAAADADARIDVLGIQRSAGGAGSYYRISDSSSGATRPDCRAPVNDLGTPSSETQSSVIEPVPPTELAEPDVSLDVADAAVGEDEIRTGLGRDSGELVAQAAAPLRRGQPLPEWVAVYSRPLVSVSEAVGLIRQQVLVAGLLALLVALAGGLVVARALARRVRRLESAAHDVAAGRSVEPLPIDSEDELGQLTRTFNDMQEQLARTERARRDFIANASHELRTPIFSLGGFAELLQDEDLDDETRDRFLASMREQIDRLQKLSADLLDLSRLDAGALTMHLRDVDLAEVVERVAAEFEPAAVERGADLTVELPADGIEAWCDPDRLAQVVRILLDNALRHTPEGTAVTVSAARVDRRAEITVVDTGPGLGENAAERVFERFYTSDASRGSGLGLAIAHELIDRMGGRIALRPGPGDNEFVVALPTAPPGAPPAAGDGLHATAPGARSSAGEPLAGVGARRSGGRAS
jgi:signal transduction histidine kinase